MYESYGWMADLGSGNPGWLRGLTKIPHGETATPVAGLIAGSLPVGNSNYNVVLGNTYYVGKTGSDTTGNGSSSDPWLTVQKAINSAPNNSIICVRAGVYHEELTTVANKVLTVQAAPFEAVWFDGSSTYTNWTASGSTWSTPYSVTFDRSLSGNLANYPGGATRSLVDQVWVDSLALTQIADNATPGPGQFSVNQSTDRLTIGTNPTGKTVRVADLDSWLVASGKISFYGIGVRRYSPQMIEFLNAMAYFGGTSAGSIMENCVFQESAMAGLSFSVADIIVRSCTIQDNGYSGVLFTNADRLLFQKNLIRRMNRGGWSGEPATAGIKGTRTDLLYIRDNYMVDVPGAYGIWLDVSCIRYKISNNVVMASGMSVGIEVEESDGGTISGVTYKSYVVGNKVRDSKIGIKVLATGNTIVANNDVRGNDLGIYEQQDRPQNDGSQPANRPNAVCPWWTVKNWFINNMFDVNGSVNIFQQQFLAYDDGPKSLRGWDMIEKFAGNQMHTSGTMVALGAIGGARTAYNTLAALAGSGSAVGGPPGAKLGTNYQGTGSAPNSQAIAADASMADGLYIALDQKLVGPNVAKLPTYQEA